MIETALNAIAKNTHPGLETVVFCGFTSQEQAELSDIAASVAWACSEREVGVSL